jgi:hypothetical protein
MGTDGWPIEETAELEDAGVGEGLEGKDGQDSQDGQDGAGAEGEGDPTAEILEVLGKDPARAAALEEARAELEASAKVATGPSAEETEAALAALRETNPALADAYEKKLAAQAAAQEVVGGMDNAALEEAATDQYLAVANLLERTGREVETLGGAFDQAEAQYQALAAAVTAAREAGETEGALFQVAERQLAEAAGARQRAARAYMERREGAVQLRTVNAELDHLPQLRPYRALYLQLRAAGQIHAGMTVAQRVGAVDAALRGAGKAGLRGPAATTAAQKATAVERFKAMRRGAGGTGTTGGAAPMTGAKGAKGGAGGEGYKSRDAESQLALKADWKF